MPPTISSPLRLLVLSTPDTPYPTCLKGTNYLSYTCYSISPPESPGILALLSLTTPPPDTSHHAIRTPYYNASIPIWHDDAPTIPPSIASWKDEWSNSEAGEVVQAVGAWVVCFKKPRKKADLVHNSHIYGIEGHY